MASLNDRNRSASREANRLARSTARRHREDEFKPPRRHAGRLILWAPEAGRRVVARHAEPPRIISERAGGWRAIPRLAHRPLTVWDGYELLRMQIVVLLDGWMEFPARSVESELTAIRDMAAKVDGLDRPPWLRAIGVVPYTGTRWVIESMTVDETKHVRGRLVRGRVTLILMEFVSPVVDLRVERARRTSRPRSHRWERGDTVEKLARRYLRDSRRAADIRAENPRIRKWSQVRPGTLVRIPVG